MKWPIIIAAALLAQGAQAASSKTIFAHPEKYVGKTVKVCGYVEYEPENMNIWIDRAHSTQDTMGLGLGGPDLSTWHKSKVCLTGKVARTHCRDGNTVCLTTAFDYGLTVTDAIPEH